MSDSKTHSGKRNTKGNKGSIIVETSLIFVAFSFMMFGVFDFGQFLFISQALGDRVRYAARWGALNNTPDTTAVQNMVLYKQSTAPVGVTSGVFGLTSSNVSVTTAGDGTDDFRLTVTIQNYNFPAMILAHYFATGGPKISSTSPLIAN